MQSVVLNWVSLCWGYSFVYHYAERRYAERRYAECRYAECRGAVDCLIMSHSIGMLPTLPANSEFTQKLVWDKRSSFFESSVTKKKKSFVTLKIGRLRGWNLPGTQWRIGASLIKPVSFNNNLVCFNYRLYRLYYID
jgi:hypothetical protein